MSAFVFQHVMKVPSWATAALVGCFALGTLAMIPVWVRLAARFGKSRCWRYSLCMVGVLYLGMFVGLQNGLSVEPSVLIASGLASALLGGAQASNFVLSRSMQADVIDYDEVGSGERKEGAYLATWSFVEKCSGAAAAIMIGAALQLVDYQPGVEQSDLARITILGLMSLVPSACHFASALALRGFGLDQEEHVRIRQVLEQRRAEGLAS